MLTSVSKFNYELPKEFIAQSPIVPRELAKLMIVNKKNKFINHKHVFDLPDYFQKGDLIVVNNTKVFKAKLYGFINLHNNIKSKIEILLIRPIGSSTWTAIGQPGKKLLPGREIVFHKNFSANIAEKKSDGSLVLNFNQSFKKVIYKANLYGLVPIPQYIKKQPTLSEYQTSYAKIIGSVAAPTAGFHLTAKIRKQLTEKGVKIVEITLHVGLGTFVPIKTNNIENHLMHSEWVNISGKTAKIINDAKSQKRRIIAIGTTTVRTLEGVARLNNGKISSFSGDIDIFIKPGFKFTIIDGMLTNFHLPKSTLIILVSAFVGINPILNLYKEAVKQKYRFYSFGDAMLIL